MCGLREPGKMCISFCSRAQEHQVEVTNEDAQANPDFAKLLDYALCCAIRSGRDDSVMDPPDIEDATHSLPSVEYQNGRLARKLK